MKGFIVIFCVTAAAYCQTPQSKRVIPCPKIQPMQNLNIVDKKLFGNWYGCAESVTNFPDFNKCTKLIIEPNGPYGWCSIFSGVSNKTGYRLSATATIEVNEQKHALTSVHYNSLPSGPFSISVTIIDTDYDNYLILWSCMDDQPQQTPGLWMLVRDPKTCQNHNEKLKSTMENMGVNLTMNSVDQINCS